MTGLFFHYRFLAMAIWLLAVACSLAWNLTDNARERHTMALETARSFYEQIIAVRRWNLMHGGVYVYTTDKSPPNPYIPEDSQSIKDSSGRSLTLINPSYMTRQISTIARTNGYVDFHITSLTPLREKNRPYPWEIPWLESFKKGAKEQSTFVQQEEGEIFRYMAPLVFTDSCLPCHAPPAHPEDSTRGAISVTLPIQFRNSPWPLILSHLFIAIGGISGIVFFGGRLARNRKSILQANKQLEQEIKGHKQTEKELLTIKENLENLVDKRTSDLQQINSTLDARIKEHQKTEDSLIASNDELIQIFNSTPDGMHIIDFDFNIIRANTAFCQLTGKRPEEILDHKCYDVFPGRYCHTQQCALTRIRNGAEMVEVEARKSRHDGESFPCIVTIVPFRDPQGKTIGIIEVTRDISSWKEIERSLSSTAERLRKRNLELEDFTHVISHDLQEPLMLIRAFSEKIRSKCSTDLPEHGKAYLERIESSTGRMQSLIDGLLLYSRVSSKANPYEKLELNTIIDSVLDDLTVRIEKTEATVNVEKDLGIIEAEPLQMRQLFQNIIGNSLKYHHLERKPAITIKRIPFSDPFNDQNYIRISIRDNGIGFDPKFQALIFDIFQRLHTRQQFQGTGIGLSICKKIVDRHQGTISAKGTPNQGAEFIITLPPIQKHRHKDSSSKSKNLIDIVMNRR